MAVIPLDKCALVFWSGGYYTINGIHCDWVVVCYWSRMVTGSLLCIILYLYTEITFGIALGSMYFGDRSKENIRITVV